MNKFQFIVFDLDKTLYPKNNGLLDEICKRMDLFISQNFKDINNAKEYREELFNKYGTSLSGLRKEKGVNPAEFYRFIHDFDIESFLKRDEKLISLFYNTEQEKILFTNAPRSYALRVLKKLGIEKFFLDKDILDIYALRFNNKPQEKAYNILVNYINTDPEKVIIADDYEHNLKPAKELGMTTVLVGNEDNGKYQYVDYYINKITEIEKIL